MHRLESDTSRPVTKDSIAADKIEGIVAIAAEIGSKPRRTQYLLERGMIPCGKVGHIWVASRKTLRAHFKQLTGGNAAA
jgi:hypothetical protein